MAFDFKFCILTLFAYENLAVIANSTAVANRTEGIGEFHTNRTGFSVLTEADRGPQVTNCDPGVGVYFELDCDHGTCGRDGCLFDGTCITLKKFSTCQLLNEQAIREEAEEICRSEHNGYLAGIRSLSTQDVFSNIFRQHVPTTSSVLTSGWSNNCSSGSFSWKSGNTSTETNEAIPVIFDKNSSGDPCSIWLKYPSDEAVTTGAGNLKVNTIETFLEECGNFSVTDSLEEGVTPLSSLNGSRQLLWLGEKERNFVKLIGNNAMSGDFVLMFRNDEQITYQFLNFKRQGTEIEIPFLAMDATSQSAIRMYRVNGYPGKIPNRVHRNGTVLSRLAILNICDNLKSKQNWTFGYLLQNSTGLILKEAAEDCEMMGEDWNSSFELRGVFQHVWHYQEPVQKMIDKGFNWVGSSRIVGSDPFFLCDFPVPAIKSCICLENSTNSLKSEVYQLEVGRTRRWKCPDIYNGFIESSCVRTSSDKCKFQPYPDYTNCSAKWVENIATKAEEILAGPINATGATAIVEKIINQTSADSAVVETDFVKLLSLVQRTVVARKNSTSFEANNIKNQTSLETNRTEEIPDVEQRLTEHEILTESASKVLDTLVNKSILNEKPDSEMSNVVINFIEKVTLTLAEVAKEEDKCENYTKEINRNSFHSTVYALNKENLGLSGLTYSPSGAKSVGLSLSLDNKEVYSDCLLMVGFFLSTNKLEALYSPETTSKPEDTTSSNSTSNSITKSEVVRKSDQVLNSDIVGFTIKISKTENSSTPQQALQVKIELKNKIEGKYPYYKTIHRCDPGHSTAMKGSASCRFWEPKEKKWKSDNCTVVSENSTHTVCACNHLTAFGSLMSLHEYQCWSDPLDKVTTISESLSVVCLIFTMIIYGIPGLSAGYVGVNAEKRVILLNICFWLAASHVLILLFMNKNWTILEGNACIAVGVILHFSLLTAFAWMLVEGIGLYKKVVVIFNSKSHWLLESKAFTGYTIPAIIIGVTLTVGFTEKEGIYEAYGNTAQCWLNVDNGYIWAFNGPVLCIITVNLFILVKALTIAAKAKSGNKDLIWIRKWIRSAVSLTILLGITWAVGMLTFIPDEWPLYVFGILNGLQGVFVFLFNCVLSERIVKTPSAAKSRSRSKESQEKVQKRPEATKNVSESSTSRIFPMSGKRMSALGAVVWNAYYKPLRSNFNSDFESTFVSSIPEEKA